MPMSGEVVAIVERLFKAFIFVPCMALIAWWVFSSWLDRTLKASEAAIGLALLAGAFLLGVVSIITGGWGFLGVLAFLYLAALGMVAWEYVYWRRRDKQHLLEEVKKYEQAISLDPRNAAAYSFLGKTHLALGNMDEAAAALEQALALDPESHTDRSLLREVREIQARVEAQGRTAKR
jgi:tetratricopeptide (TPR) repeat protein